MSFLFALCFYGRLSQRRVESTLCLITPTILLESFKDDSHLRMLEEADDMLRWHVGNKLACLSLFRN